jgi:ankyrin repeat protein
MSSRVETRSPRHGLPRCSSVNFDQQSVRFIQCNDYFSLDELLSTCSVSSRLIRGAVYCLEAAVRDPSPLLPTDNLTLLHIAASCDALESFLVLQNHGLSHQTLSGYSDLPIHYACLYGSLEVLTHILERDPAQISSQKLLLLAASSRCPNVIEILFAYGMPQFDEVGPIDATLVNHDLRSLKLLLPHYVQSGRNSSALLTSAVLKGAREQLELLLEAGETPTRFCQTSPLAIACFVQKPELLRCLVNKAFDLDPPNDVRVKCGVHWMCESGSLEIAEILMEKAIDVTRVDEKGRAGAYYLVDRVEEEVAVRMLEMMAKAGWDVNQGKITVLGEYVGGIKPGVRPIEWLIDHGASLVGPSAIPGKSILDMIEAKGKLAPIRDRFAAEIRRLRGLGH